MLAVADIDIELIFYIFGNKMTDVSSNTFEAFDQQFDQPVSNKSALPPRKRF